MGWGWAAELSSPPPPPPSLGIHGGGLQVLGGRGSRASRGQRLTWSPPPELGDHSLQPALLLLPLPPPSPLPPPENERKTEGDGAEQRRRE